MIPRSIAYKYLHAMLGIFGSSRTRRPAGSAAKGRDSGEFRPICQNSEKYPLTWAEREGLRARDSVVDCGEISSGGPGKYRRFADPPPARFCSEGARFRGVPLDLAKFNKMPTYLGWVCVGGSHLVILRSTAYGVSSGNPKKFRRFADPPSGRFCGEGARFRKIPPDLPKFSEIATYLD